MSRYVPHVVHRQLSPNRSSRRGARPRLITVHSTEGSNIPDSPADLVGCAGFLCRPGVEASSHVITDGDGHSARIVRDEDKAWHCFAGDEQIITENGPRPFADVADTMQMVLTSSCIQPADVRSFGEQPLNRVVLAPAHQRRHWRNGATYWASWGTRERRSVRVTPDHEWVLADGGTTRDLKVGDVVPGCVREPDRDSDAFREGLRDGFVFGDGYTGKASLTHGTRYYAPMHGERKAAMGPLFERVAHWSSRAAREHTYRGTGVCSSWRDLKDIPDDVDDLDYLAGWLRGWIAADASFDGTSYALGSVNYEALMFARAMAPLAGMTVVGGRPYGPTSGGYTDDAEFGTVGLREGALAWKVASIEEDGTEEVFCAVVDRTHDFALAGGVLTHNCARYNAVSLGIEQIGRAGTEHWTRDEIRETARWIARWSVKFGIPIRKGAVSGGFVTRSGVVTHKMLGVLGGSHVDPGPRYPFDACLKLARFYRGKL